MNIYSNFSTPFFNFLSDDIQKGILSKIESYVGNKTELILVIGTKKEKIQSIGRYFRAAFFLLLHSKVTVCSMKMLMAKMLEIAFNSQNFPQSPQVILFSVIKFEWLKNIPIDLTKVYNLYNLSSPYDISLQDDEKEEKCSMALLNAFTQVLLSANCSLADHIEWTTILGISFYNCFLNLCQEVTEKTTCDCLKELLPASENSVQSTPHILRPGQPYSRSRIRIPEKARIFMEEFLDKKVGVITQNEVNCIASMFEMTALQVRVFFKNRKSRLRKVELEGLNSNVSHQLSQQHQNGRSLPRRKK